MRMMTFQALLVSSIVIFTGGSNVFAQQRMCTVEKDADNGASVEVSRWLATDHNLKQCNQVGRYVVAITEARMCDRPEIELRPSSFFQRNGDGSFIQVWCGNKYLGRYENATLQEMFVDHTLVRRNGSGVDGRQIWEHDHGDDRIYGYFQQKPDSTMIFVPPNQIAVR